MKLAIFFTTCVLSLPLFAANATDSSPLTRGFQNQGVLEKVTRDYYGNCGSTDVRLSGVEVSPSPKSEGGILLNFDGAELTLSNDGRLTFTDFSEQLHELRELAIACLKTPQGFRVVVGAYVNAAFLCGNSCEGPDKPVFLIIDPKTIRSRPFDPVNPNVITIQAPVQPQFSIEETSKILSVEVPELHKLFNL